MGGVQRNEKLMKSRKRSSYTSETNQKQKGKDRATRGKMRIELSQEESLEDRVAAFFCSFLMTLSRNRRVDLHRRQASLSTTRDPTARKLHLRKYWQKPTPSFPTHARTRL